MGAVEREIVDKIRAFYNEFPFPGYEVDDYYSVASLYDRASPYVKMLDRQMPSGLRVLDVGCGTGQLAALLSIANREVLGIDLSESSIAMANSLKEGLDLPNVTFVQGNLFDVHLPEDSFDYVLCNGVLHNTHDPYRGFVILCSWVKPGGYIIIGLYNTYGRFFTKVRGLLFRLFGTTVGDRLTKLDYFMRRQDLPDVQKRAWFYDQYHNPHETAHTIEEVLAWFRTNGIDYINGIPKIRLFQPFSPDERLFEGEPKVGGWIEHTLVQLGWVLTTQKEGGYFLSIGRKRR
ncbi:MAG: methyltransferase domain-containing protein [Anaerolineae bacterium]|nr:methyltransferase domain-containing protein [Anaerolineae bacterium]